MSDEPISNGEKPDTRFKPGNLANPTGRPPGSRNKLGEDFVAALQADFKAHGQAAIEKVRQDRPQDYLKVIASILPRQVEIKETPFDGVPDDTLAAFLVAARSAFVADLTHGEGASH